jgi:hypothetical protein
LGIVYKGQGRSMYIVRALPKSASALVLKRIKHWNHSNFFSKIDVKDKISFLDRRSLWVALWRDLAGVNIIQVAAGRYTIHEGDKAGQDVVSHGILNEVCWGSATCFHLSYC